MLKGSCLCADIRHELDSPLGPIGICHCSRCRKSSGTAFAVNATIDKAGFRLVAGAASLARFASLPGVTRIFCRRCSSSIYSRRDSAPNALRLRLRLGTLNTPITERPAFHFFVDAKAEWDLIHDDLPQSPERPQDPGALAPGRRSTP